MIRVGYLISQYPAPSHTFIRREIEALRRRGLEIVTFSLNPPGAHERLGAADQAEQQATWYLQPVKLGALLVAHLAALFTRPRAYFSLLAESMGHRNRGLRAFFYGFFYFGEAIYIARALKQRGVTRVHSHFANAGGTVGMLAARFLGLPWSITLHGISEFDFPNGTLLGKKLARADFAACVTMFGMAQAMRVIDPDDWHKLILVRCGVDPRTLPPRTDPRPPGPPRIVCVGRLSPEKGHLGLLEAFSQAIARGLKAEVRLVGGGPEQARIVERIARLGLQDQCIVLGQLPENETLREISNADVLVSTSFMEGLPVVLMEAMALGIPAVAPRLAGVPELIEDGVTGLLFHPADWSLLCDTLIKLMDDPALREKLGKAGRQRVLTEFDIDRACQRLHRQLVPGADDVAHSRRSLAHMQAVPKPRSPEQP